MATEKVLTGRVKWFNNKSGFGFITVVLSPDNESVVGQEIFAHHSSIVVGKEQFRYLVQGEYVEFTLSEITEEGSAHKYQTSNVHGIGGGFLMCETRFDAKQNDAEDGDNSAAPKWDVSRNSKKSKKATPAKGRL